MICFSCNSVPFRLVSTKPASPGSHIHVQPLTSHECHFFCCYLRSLLTCWITAATLRSLPTLHPSPPSLRAQNLSLLAPSPGPTTSDFKQGFLTIILWTTLPNSPPPPPSLHCLTCPLVSQILPSLPAFAPHACLSLLLIAFICSAELSLVFK